MNWNTLIPVQATDLAGAISGMLANPVFATGLLVVLGAVLSPTILRAIFKVFGRR